VEAGRGDVPLTQLRFRCSNCGSDRTDFVVTSRDNPRRGERRETEDRLFMGVARLDMPARPRPPCSRGEARPRSLS
jgi:hypothetical protein